MTRLRLHEGTSYMFITGPDVVKTVTGEEVTFERGARRRSERPVGRCALRSADEESCLEDARYLISFLPQNNLDPPPFFQGRPTRDREDARSSTIIPDNANKPYDIKQVITGGRRRPGSRGARTWAQNLVWVRRLGGYVVASSPASRRRSPACRHRLVGQGRALRPHLERSTSAHHLRRRARLPSRVQRGVGGSSSRRQAALRLLRGTVQTDGDHAA